MIKTNLRIKDNISLTDQIMVINDIVAAYFKNGDYTPYYAEMGEIIAVGTYLLEGYELEEGENIYTLYYTDSDVHKLIDMFINNSNQKSQNVAVMKFIREMVKDKLTFAKERAVYSHRQMDEFFATFNEFMIVIIDAFGNFANLNLSALSPEMIKNAQTVYQKMADSGFKMTEDSIVNVIKEAANFKPDEASKEIIEAKNAEIRELKKYKTLWESRNTSK